MFVIVIERARSFPPMNIVAESPPGRSRPQRRVQPLCGSQMLDHRRSHCRVYLRGCRSLPTGPNFPSYPHSCPCDNSIQATYSRLPGVRAWGTVMRINRLMLTQTVIAMSVALGVWYLQKRVGGPVGGMIPGVLGFCLGWFITPALLEDIDRVRGWLLRRRAGRELQPK